MERLYLQNLPVDNGTMEEAVNIVTEMALDQRGPRHSRRHCARIFFLNAHCANVAARDPEYRRALLDSDYCFADGAGVRLAAAFQGRRILDNVNGTDLFPLLMERLARTHARVFFVGAKRPVIASLVLEVQRRWPGVHISGWTLGYFQDNQAVVDTIRLFGADVLFVAQGVPRQELWIDRFAEATGSRVALAVGGLFDFYSGTMPRAPLWMRRLGLEWFFRFLQEPARMWRRYLLGNIEFLFRAWSVRRRGAHP